MTEAAGGGPTESFDTSSVHIFTQQDVVLSSWPADIQGGDYFIAFGVLGVTILMGLVMLFQIFKSKPPKMQSNSDNSNSSKMINVDPSFTIKALKFYLGIHPTLLGFIFPYGVILSI